jgi:hypothetical protein
MKCFECWVEILNLNTGESYSGRLAITGTQQLYLPDPAAVNFMKDVSAKILISDIFLDESIYPRENVDHKRIGIFAENLRDGFVFVNGF